MIKTELGIKRAIFKDLRQQGFEIKKGVITPKGDTKDVYRKIQLCSKQEKQERYKKFLKKNEKLVSKYFVNGGGY